MATKKATQEVVIELSNGVKGVFSGRAIAWPGQCENVNVVGVKFFTPKIKEPKKDVTAEPPKSEPPKTPPVSQSSKAQTPAPPSK